MPNRLILSHEAEVRMLEIARDGDLAARIEVARVFAHFEELEERFVRSPDYWNISQSASGHLTSQAVLRNGTPIWRLCPSHTHCIAILFKDGDTIFVRNVCNAAMIAELEGQLAAG